MLRPTWNGKNGVIQNKSTFGNPLTWSKTMMLEYATIQGIHADCASTQVHRDLARLIPILLFWQNVGIPV